MEIDTVSSRTQRKRRAEQGEMNSEKEKHAYNLL